MKKLLICLLTALIFITSASDIFAQCGADGTQPCSSTPKKKDSGKPVSKTTSTKDYSKSKPQSKNTSVVKPVSTPKSNQISQKTQDAAEDYLLTGMRCPPKDFDCQILNCTKAIELNSRYSEAYHYRGMVYRNLYKEKKDDSSFENAIKDFTAAIKFAPRNTYIQRHEASNYYASRGELYRMSGREDLAHEDFKRSGELIGLK